MGGSGDSGVSRRTFVKRSAAAGGMAVWATPLVDSFVSPAAGATRGSPACECFFCAAVPGTSIVLRCVPTDPADCACVCCCGGITSSCADCDNVDPCSVQVNCVPDPTCTV